MRGDLLDVVLVVASLLFAVSGYRQGFVVGVLSFVGFLGGGVLGARFAPSIAATGPFEGLSRTLVGLGVVFLAATVGQVLATLIGGALRKRLTWRPARQVDAVAGAAVSVVSLLLVAWLVGRAVASSPYEGLSSQVRRSVVIGTVDDLVPDSGRRLFSSLRRMVDERGFPEVFAELQRPELTDVAPPDAALASSPVVRQVRPSVLKITGEATDCGKRIEGSGFVYAPERVMTNAHVVAGVSRPMVEVGDDQLPATVVLFDPGRDVAVLAVPGLERPGLAFSEGQAEFGEGAVVLGYPKDGPFRANAARISGDQDATGLDIYGERTIEREIYSLRGLVEQGNSGGPLIDLQGRVLGVIFAAAADDRSIGYALTAQEVAGQAAAGRRATERVSSRTCNR
ncbi:MAG: peptidase and chymotrypsin/Hap [Frankiales bacterium]|nr:peptidase and chymotrypsin/Hap [Frankiales bacterium]